MGVTIILNIKVKVIKNTIVYEEHLNKIKPYLKDIINDLKKSDTWKSQLTININFVSSHNDNDEEHEMHSKSDNIEIMMNDEADEIIEERFELLKRKISKYVGRINEK